MTNKDILQGHWKEIKGRIKQQWGKLTDDEITEMRGTYDELQGLLEKHYGYRKEQAEKAINDFIERAGFKEKSY